MTSAKALKKKIAKRAKQKKNIQVKNSIRLKHKTGEDGGMVATAVVAAAATETASSDNDE